ncbi:MAG: hypothetical protein DMF76_17890 [Acidobacteria bacterium]|nr:MAG: hypothetical protein DMF76_17890 [Acidobacteriota bacterium]
MLTKRLLLLLVLFVCLAGALEVAAQDEDSSKAIKAEEFIKDRPGTTKKSSAARYKPAAKSPTTGAADTPPPGTTFAQLGVTFWRFRRSLVGDRTKELVEEEEGDWTLERIEEGTPLATGQMVRLSIESLSRAGYLYVIDREQYADGTTGDPILIFPKQKTRDANFVKAGRLIYIPSTSGKFRIKPSESSKVHVGEIVTILVSPEPLIDPAQLGPKSIKLARQQVELWEKRWGASATRFEMQGGAGQTMTEKEQAAGTDGSPELTKDDPAPQTVYRVAIKPANPIVVSVPLKFRK